MTTKVQTVMLINSDVEAWYDLVFKQPICSEQIMYRLYNGPVFGFMLPWDARQAPRHITVVASSGIFEDHSKTTLIGPSIQVSYRNVGPDRLSMGELARSGTSSQPGIYR